MTGPFKLDGSDKDLIKLLETRHDELTSNRAAFDFDAKRNLAFVRGHQYLVNAGTAAQPTLRRAQPDDEDPHTRVMLSINKIGPLTNRIIAKMTKGNPVPECRPVTMEEKDVSAARVGTRILASESFRLDLPTRIVRLYQWVVPCKTAYLHTCWDPQDGPVIGQGSKNQDIHLGNVTVNVVPHFEIVMNPDANDMLDARWCIHEMAMTAEEIYEVWGKEVTDGPRVQTLSAEMSGLQLGSFPSGSHPNKEEKLSVKRFWLRAGQNRSRQNGMMFTWCGDTVLESRQDFPYDHNHLPFAQFNFLPPQEGQLGNTTVSWAIEPQKDYNHARSREADIRDRLVPKLLAQLNQIDPSMVSQFAELLTYRGAGLPPQYIDVPQGWQGLWENAMSRADAEMGDATGITEAAKGGLAGTSPGVTVLAQQEAAAEPLGTPAKEMAKGLSEYGWQHLMLVKQYWDEKRVVRTWSESGLTEVERFQGADLSSELDVHVTPESALPRSKAGKTELAIQLWQNQLVTDPRVFIKMLDLPSTDILAKSFDEDVKHAERENDKLIHVKMNHTAVPKLDPQTGQPVLGPDGRPQIDVEHSMEGMPKVEDWHNHVVHVATHNSYRKTDEFQNRSDLVKAAFDQHVAVHMEIIGSLQARQEQLAAGAGAQGAPGTPPGFDASQLGQPGGSSSVAAPDISQLAQIGGRAGRPGPVPGVPLDQQAAAIGE